MRIANTHTIMYVIDFSYAINVEPSCIGPFDTLAHAMDYAQLHCDGMVGYRELKPPFHSGECDVNCISHDAPNHNPIA